MHRAQADFQHGRGAEGFAKAVNAFVEKHAHRFGGVIASVKAGAAGNQHDLHGRIGNPGGDLRTDGVFIVREQHARREMVPRFGQRILQILPGGIFRQRARIRNGQHGNIQRIKGFFSMFAHKKLRS